ncbi:MAG: acyl carrier protein [Bacteroidaceae bacterium]|nr:acyl carrier protein [Bacteroidaceae bacterium]
MTRDEIVKNVNEILADEYEVEVEEMEASAEMREVLPIDSLSIVDLVALIQANYKVTIPVSELPNLKTFNDLYDYIFNHLPEN